MLLKVVVAPQSSPLPLCILTISFVPLCGPVLIWHLTIGPKERTPFLHEGNLLCHVLQDILSYCKLTLSSVCVLLRARNQSLDFYAHMWTYVYMQTHTRVYTYNTHTLRERGDEKGGRNEEREGGGKEIHLWGWSSGICFNWSSRWFWCTLKFENHGHMQLEIN